MRWTTVVGELIAAMLVVAMLCGALVLMVDAIRWAADALEAIL